jgi:glycosyltransferase involved in cell wall biosynthesis
MTELSVLMPVKNAARHLTAALQSLQRQSRPADQVVVVDDASADATYAILRTWQRHLPLHIVLGQGRGIACALNLGLSACEGGLVARMDADDVMHPLRLETQLRFMQTHAHMAVCGTEVRSFPPSRVTERRAAYDAWLSSLHTAADHARDIYVEAPLCHPSTLIRRSALLRLGGYHTVPWPEDYDLWLRMHAAGGSMGKPHGVLHFWRERSDRLSRTHASYQRGAIRRCRLHHLSEHFSLRKRGVVIVGAGLEGKAAGRVLLAQGVPVHAHVDADPRKVGGRLGGEGGVRVWGPQDLHALMNRTPMPLAVVAIGTAGARSKLRSELAARGIKEGVDAVLVV